ncbi:MAG: hypothetical protein O3B09_01245 [Proteobacteria bacterium]|nr:hypothetical protein [Pseudomonadota bacterium]
MQLSKITSLSLIFALTLLVSFSANAQVYINPEDAICFRNASTATNYPTQGFIQIEDAESEVITPKKYPYLFEIPTQKSDYCRKIIANYEMRVDELNRMQAAEEKIMELGTRLVELINLDAAQSEDVQLQRRINLAVHNIRERLLAQKAVVKELEEIEAREAGKRINVAENLLLKEEQSFRLNAVGRNLDEAAKTLNRNRRKELEEAGEMLTKAPQILEESKNVNLQERKGNLVLEKAEEIISDIENLLEKAATSKLTQTNDMLNEEELELKDIYYVRLKEVNKLMVYDSERLNNMNRDFARLTNSIDDFVSKFEALYLSGRLSDLKFIEVAAKDDIFVRLRNIHLREVESNKFNDIKKNIAATEAIISNIHDLRVTKFNELEQKRLIMNGLLEEESVLIDNVEALFEQESRMISSNDRIEDIKIGKIINKVEEIDSKMNEMDKKMTVINDDFDDLKQIPTISYKSNQYRQVESLLNKVESRFVELYAARIRELSKYNDSTQSKMDLVGDRLVNIKVSLRKLDSSKLVARNSRIFNKINQILSDVKDDFEKARDLKPQQYQYFDARIKSFNKELEEVADIESTKFDDHDSDLKEDQFDEKFLKIRDQYFDISQGIDLERKKLNKKQFLAIKLVRFELKLDSLNKEIDQFSKELIKLDNIKLGKAKNFNIEQEINAKLQKIYLELKADRKKLPKSKNIFQRVFGFN